MCLIIAAGKGTKKNTDFLFNAIKKAAVSNTDGIGYTFKKAKDKDKVWIAKGFKDVDKFISNLKSKRLKVDDELIIHLRIGNKGGKTTDMNHPFVLSDKTEEILTNNQYVEAPTMVHNGTFNAFSETNSVYSDTFYFIQRFMYIPEFQSLLKRDIVLFKHIFTNTLQTNKLAFIFPGEQEMLTVGEYLEEDGYKFSNISYKQERYRNIGGYEDYYESEDYYKNYYTNSHNHRPASTIKTIDKDRDITPNMSVNILDKFTNRNIYSHFGGNLFVPYSFSTEQYKESKFVPKHFNYKHFRLYSRAAQFKLGLVGYENYVIDSYDRNSKNQCHILWPMTNPKDDWTDRAYVNTTEILENCAIYAKIDYTYVYEMLFNLIKKYDASKSLLNAIRGVIVNSSGESKNMVKFKDVHNVPLLTLKIWYNYMAIHLFGENTIPDDRFYVVQEEDAPEKAAERSEIIVN